MPTHLQIASEKIILCFVVPKQKQQPALKRRSLCPLNASVEILGDRWSLLILRDMMLRQANTYKAFLECAEGIATNILADRLKRLEADGIITSRPDPSDGRKQIYQLTRKGIDLAPVLTEMVLWAGKHEEVGNHALIRLMQKDKEKFLNEIFTRWASHSSPGTPGEAG